MLRLVTIKTNKTLIQFKKMANSPVPEPELLRAILEPLLADFQYWFEKSHHLLETENVSFLTPAQQNDLLARVQQAEKEVAAAQVLFHATDGKVGIEMATMVPWHRLLTECWQVSMKFRMDCLSGEK